MSSKLNVNFVTGSSAEIHGDFDQTGTVDNNTSERDRRMRRPGSIVLPNLNLSAGLPAGSPGVDLSNGRDADNAAVENSADLDELSLIEIRSPSTGMLEADELVLHVHANDVSRFHLFQDSGGAPNTWPVILGKSVGADASIVFPSAVSFQFRYYMEGLTLPGGPLPATSAPPPDTPPQPVGMDTSGNVVFGAPGSPPYAARGPGEIWLELQHKRGGTLLSNNSDLALFLVARFILQSNVEPCERIYVTYLKRSGQQPENHDFVYDLMEACWEAFSSGGPGSFNRTSSTPFTPSVPADVSNPDSKTSGACCLSPGKLYLINGEKYPDEWVQDEFEMGYCNIPGNKGFNIAFHCRRDRELKDFVRKELAGRDIGLFHEVSGAPRDSTDYGGNIEVSPPVMAATPAQAKSNAGPSFPAHPAAPFGKILLGDCRNGNRTGNGMVHDQTRTFLLDQLVQPVIPLNTSWLGVGHIDEVMSFIPSGKPRGSALCIASVYTMDRLVQEIIKVPVKDGRTSFHRGKFEEHRDMVSDSVATGNVSPINWFSYAEVTPENLFNGDVGKYSRTIRTRFMAPIMQRLQSATAHTNADVIRVPIYFKPGTDPTKPFGHDDNITVAETVGMVNMQVVNNHLMVPKPFGPRMKRSTAEGIVRKIVGPSMTIVSSSDTEFPFWVFPGLSFDRVAQFFARPDTQTERDSIVDRIRDDTVTLPAPLQALVDNKKAQIAASNPGMPPPAGGIFDSWYRLMIPEDTVDVIETYMLTVLSNIGCRVHFVDDWFYHVGWGEAHCATNAKRRPRLDAQWWKIYDPEANLRYDPAL